MGARAKERDVDWGVVIRKIAQKLLKGIGKTRPATISRFLYHLYVNVELLTNVEEQEYNTSLTYNEVGVT